MHGTIHVYIDTMHPCMCNNSSTYLELHTFANGTTHVCTWKYTYVLTILMRDSRTQQLKTTASKQINKIDRAYLYHGSWDHFSNKMSCKNREY